ncbi:hypothetical protein PVAP13_6NG047106 [Panicum virgatum]|uniref:Uncharacterized protein n=1 Tax=Panicum virgatum TaxID=38727 RepID=A0A8T0R0R2_PANVG|nr:hypothetical protein PVAP13_6NG047106 [Panicum virgatum]
MTTFRCDAFRKGTTPKMPPSHAFAQRYLSFPFRTNAGPDDPLASHHHCRKSHPAPPVRHRHASCTSQPPSCADRHPFGRAAHDPLTPPHAPLAHDRLPHARSNAPATRPVRTYAHVHVGATASSPPATHAHPRRARPPVPLRARRRPSTEHTPARAAGAHPRRVRAPTPHSGTDPPRGPPDPAAGAPDPASPAPVPPARGGPVVSRSDHVCREMREEKAASPSLSSRAAWASADRLQRQRGGGDGEEGPCGGGGEVVGPTAGHRSTPRERAAGPSSSCLVAGPRSRIRPPQEREIEGEGEREWRGTKGGEGRRAGRPRAPCGPAAGPSSSCLVAAPRSRIRPAQEREIEREGERESGEGRREGRAAGQNGATRSPRPHLASTPPGCASASAYGRLPPAAALPPRQGARP